MHNIKEMNENSISILIPCYNAEQFLPSLFEGIKTQTLPFDEVICYDDCSSDNTVTVAEQLGARVICGAHNKGPAFGRNRLLEASTSKYVHFHDADDLIDKYFVEKMVEHITDENTQLLCNTFVYDLNNRNTNLGNITYDGLKECNDQLLFFLENVGFASMGLYSKKALLGIGGFNEDLMGNEDPDLHIRLSIAGYKVKSVPEFLVTKLEHANSLSHSNWFQCLSDKYKCIQKYSEVLEEKYHRVLASQSAELSNYFYREGDERLSKNARQLAMKLGLKKVTNSRFSSLASTFFGVGFYLWLYRRRVDLRLI